jgi:tetratricopeptide (TPR) repeat protein
MTGPHEDRVRELFFAALDVPAERRAAFLEEQCGGDVQLLARVAGLLSHDESAGAFMASPPVAIDGEEGLRMPRGRRIGRYRIVRVIGAGGMGVVYEAEQEHPHRTVALKVLRRSAASRQAMRRFDHEVEILGLLQHPNIAQIHEAGTFDEGEGAQPFFAMEHVRGRSLLAYVRAARPTAPDRLRLFVTICEAVQYAHQRGVIHRDLKPGNILVDDEGEPKILDFGVARATDSDIQTTTLETAMGQLVGTVAYMSPEQVAGDSRELDTRSDVYSLGVLLYELLADRLPHDLEDRSIPEAVRIIGEDDPTPLSSVNRMFRGDLDTIVAKALEKERDRRYHTAAELAADIRHYLADEPIVARPASTFYQFRKFARRNRGLVAGVTAAFAILLVSLIVVAIQAISIRREATRAAENSAFFESLMLRANIAGNEARMIAPTEVGVNLRLVDVLAEAVQRLDAQPLVDRRLEATFRYRAGEAFFAASRVFDSRDQLERALEIRREILPEDHPDIVDCKVSLAWTYHWIAGHDARAEELAREAVATLEAGSDPPDERYLHALFTLAACQFFGRNPEGGIQAAGRILEILDASEEPIDFARFVPNTQIGIALCVLGRLEEAEQHLAEARRDFQRETTGQHVAKSLIEEAFGLLAARRGQWDEAERHFALAEQNDAAYRGENTYFGSETLMLRARAEEWRGDWIASAAAWSRIMANAERSLGSDNVNTAWCARNLGFRLMRAARLTESEEAYRRWDEIADRIEVPASLSPDWTTYWFARVLAANGNTGEAEDQFRRSLEMALDARSEDHTLSLRAGTELARLLCEQGRPAEAEPIARASVAGYRRTREAPDPHMLHALHTLACIRRDLGQAEAASDLFDEIEAAPRKLDRSRGELDDRRYFPHDAECLFEIGRPEEAESILLAVSPPAPDVLAYLVRLCEAGGMQEKAAEYRAILAGARGD